MKLTARLRKWLIDEVNVKANATDEEFLKAAGAALADGSLSVEKYSELTTDEEEKAVSELQSTLKSIADGMAAIKESLAQPKSTESAPAEEEKQKGGADEGGTKNSEPDGTKAVGSDGAATGDTTAMSIEQIRQALGHNAGGDDLLDGSKSVSAAPRVKKAVESYGTTKSALVYPDRTQKGGVHTFSGERVTDMGRGLDSASERGKALAGAWAKFQLASAIPRIAGSAQRAWEMLSDHEKCLLHHLCAEEQWDSSVDEKSRIQKGYAPGGIKALIDDSTSGGLEAAPIVFDDMVIETPLLYGELFPLVNTVPLARGRRIEGVEIGTVTGSWGGVDDSAINLFNTASYVSAFDTTIFRWEGAIRIGLDFMSDTPLDFGAAITRQYGERLLEDLDDVIAVGNGTTQPEGVMNKSGATSVAFGGTTSLGNYESLRFGVSKAEHRSTIARTAVFCGTETSYQRARAIPVGASDARRLGGMNYDSYTWMERPYKINESLSNSQIFYAILARYRMYRRRGFSVRQSTEGDTLIRNNEMLMVAMARYGGQAERGAVVASTTTAPA